MLIFMVLDVFMTSLQTFVEVADKKDLKTHFIEWELRIWLTISSLQSFYLIFSEKVHANQYFLRLELIVKYFLSIFNLVCLQWMLFQPDYFVQRYICTHIFGWEGKNLFFCLERRKGTPCLYDVYASHIFELEGKNMCKCLKCIILFYKKERISLPVN